MSQLNLGILAHVDAGKTSLTERLLYRQGAITRLGSVDAGTTQTDSLALEQQRGITIKTAVASFAIGDLTVNVIDTPGHPDFIAEVERVLSVLDGAVLVISAVEGVQAQTRILMRALQRLSIPTLLFINKIDRRGAQEETLLRAMAEKLSPALFPLTTTRQLGTREAEAVAADVEDPVVATRLLDRLSERDDALMAEWLASDGWLSTDRLLAALALQTRSARAHPVYFGSAITGAGVDLLLDGIRAFLPTATGDVNALPAGTVFKIERGGAGEKIAYVRMTAGTLHVRDQLRYGPDGDGRVVGIQVYERGLAVRRPSISAGQIGKLWGLGDVQIGDGIGAAGGRTEQRSFAPPTLETTVVPRHIGDRAALHVALTQLTEQDPLINLRQGEFDKDLTLSLYGDVQKEVIGETLHREYGLEVDFSETRTLCIERPAGIGASVDVMGGPDNPFVATIGLRVEPAPVDSGLDYGLEVELGCLPLSFHKAIQETVIETLRQGLFGWPLLDARIRLTHAAYSSPVSTAADFRGLTPLVIMDALRAAGSEVYEPVNRFHLEFPVDLLGRMLPAIAKMGAVPEIPMVRDTVGVLEGTIAVARVRDLKIVLPGLTRGEGLFEYAFDHYDRVRDPEPPTQPRRDNNPLNRREYLLHVVRRV